MSLRPMLLTIALVATPVTGFAQQPAPANSIGMEFVRIQPGTMQVGVYQPSCPDPVRPEAGPAAAHNQEGAHNPEVAHNPEMGRSPEG